MFKIHLFFLLWLPCVLCAKPVDTFYGTIEVDEPVLLELIESPIFQRLKSIHQYGVAYYTTFREEYNRYDHSIGVFAILRANHATIEEQIAGLLHDVSHTAFSHVGDWVFGKENQDKDYQNDIHALYIESSGIADILNKHGFSTEQILPHEELFPALENALPNLCADRIDYNIQGAYYQGFISHEEAISIFQDLRFAENRWVSTQPELMKKLVRFSLFMTQNCWGGPTNHVASRWLADAILRAIELGVISKKDFHFGTDQDIWDRLVLQEDPIIAEKMHLVLHAEDYYSVVDEGSEADFIVKSKFRGINPWVLSGLTCARLTEMDSEIAEEFHHVKEVLSRGWSIKYHQYAVQPF